MDFDQITVKDSPGLCRCCLSEGCYKDLAAEYNWMGDNEVYADMLLECFDIGISQHMDGPNGPSRLICEVCITRLRDACNFKKQVVASEKKFIDMLGRGEFQSKVMVYEADMKVEPPLDLQTEDGDDGIEYLEEIDFDDDEPLKNLASTSKSAEISPTKRGRGRPKKSEGVPEKKPKTSKDDQKKVSKNKTIVKESRDKSKGCTINVIRSNLSVVMKNSSAMPFKFYGNNYQCFFCEKTFTKVDEMRAHNITEHEGFHRMPILAHSLRQSIVNAKLDITDLCCKLCWKPIPNFGDLVDHLIGKHQLHYDRKQHDFFMCFRLADDVMKCVYCNVKHTFFMTLLRHVMTEHRTGDATCELCGLSFFDRSQLRRHMLVAHRSKTYKCRVCAKSFSSDSNRYSHEGAEHNIHHFKCSKCDCTFQTFYKRKRHIVTQHGGEPVFPCDKCPLTFLWKYHLIKHNRKVHLRETVNCPICDQKFFKSYLGTHLRSHSDDRPFACEVCMKKFKTNKTKRVHMQIHSKE